MNIANTARIKQIVVRALPIMLFFAALALHTVLAFYMEITVPEPLDNPLHAPLGEVIYAPAVWMFPAPSFRYAAMLVINGAIVSLIPPIAYKIAEKLKVANIWQRLLAAIAAGICPVVIADTKFIGTQALCFLFPCLIVLIMLNAAQAKGTVSRYFLTILLSLTIAAAVLADGRMIALALSSIAAVTLIRLCYKKQSISLFTFIVSLGVFVVLFEILTLRYQVPQSGMVRLLGYAELPSSLLEISQYLYSFAVSTWGLGVLGLCLFVKSVSRSSNDVIIKLFAAFVVFSIILSMGTGNAQSTMPLVLIMTVCGIALYGINLRDILTAIIVLGMIFTVFFTLSIGKAVDTQIVTVSAVFSLMSLFIVFVCCTERYKLRIVLGAVGLISLYFCIYTCAILLPAERNAAIHRNAPAYEVSELIYNSADAPPVVAPEEIAGLLQFLNREADIRTDVGQLENYFLISDDYKVSIVGERAIMYAASQQEQ